VMPHEAHVPGVGQVPEGTPAKDAAP
jgi:hypothetical protein